MRIIADKVSADLAAIITHLRAIEPELWSSDERRFLLPSRLGDLESPEYLMEINEKVRKLQRYRDMLNEGSINDAEYISLKDHLIFGKGEGLSGLIISKW